MRGSPPKFVEGVVGVGGVLEDMVKGSLME